MSPLRTDSSTASASADRLYRVTVNSPCPSGRTSSGVPSGTDPSMPAAPWIVKPCRPVAGLAPAELAIAWRSADRRPVLDTFLRCLAPAE
jgi:hypothetical protein